MHPMGSFLKGMLVNLFNFTLQQIYAENKSLEDTYLSW